MEFSPVVANAREREAIDTTHLKIGVAVIEQDTGSAWEWGGTLWEPLHYLPENGVIRQRWTGIFSIAVRKDIPYQKNGKQVTLYLGDLMAKADIRDQYIDSVVRLPVHLTPSADISFPLEIYDNSLSSKGSITISNTGRLRVSKAVNHLFFNGLGLSGFTNTVITYTIT